MLPAPVPGVGRRQCYLNVIKGGHQSWRSTTRRPVGRDDGCVPPFGGGWESFLGQRESSHSKAKLFLASAYLGY